MSKETAMTISNVPQLQTFGISMTQKDYLNIKSRLNLLKERCPSQCSFDLSFENRGESFIGTISIRSISEIFYSRKISTSPHRVYDLLEKDIDQQLQDWKKRRFRQSKYKTTEINTQAAQCLQ